MQQYEKMVYAALSTVHVVFYVVWKKNLVLFFFVSIFTQKERRMGEYSTKLIKPIGQCNTDSKPKCVASNFDNRNSTASIYNLCNAIDSSLRMNEQKNAIQRFPNGITIQLTQVKMRGQGNVFIWTNAAQAHFKGSAKKTENTVFKIEEIRQRITDGKYSIKEGSDTYLTITDVEGELEYDEESVFIADPKPERMNAVFLIKKIKGHRYKVIHYDDLKSQRITPQPQMTTLPQEVPQPVALPQSQMTAPPQGVPQPVALPQSQMTAPPQEVPQPVALPQQGGYSMMGIPGTIPYGGGMMMPPFMGYCPPPLVGYCPLPLVGYYFIPGNPIMPPINQAPQQAPQEK